MRDLKRRKLRTMQAVLGISLGVMLITALLAVMDGLESSITESLGLLSVLFLAYGELTFDRVDVIT